MRAAEMLAYPGDAAAIIEAHDQLGVHPHPALVASDQADQVDLVLAIRQRHEIDQRDAALGGLELRFQDAGFAAISPRALCHRLGGVQQPASPVSAPRAWDGTP